MDLGAIHKLRRQPRGEGGFPIDDVCRRKGEGGSRQNDDVVKTFNFRENWTNFKEIIVYSSVSI